MKSRLLKIVTGCILGLMAMTNLRAQSLDPTLAGMILLYTEKAKKSLESQQRAMLLETTGHIWVKEEVEATTDIQNEFNQYLSEFRGIVSYAAQIYGAYHEVDNIIENMKNLTKQIGDAPTNALAVALSANRNEIYKDIIMQSVDVVNDVRTVCMSESKMTESQRMEAFFGIRPKLKSMNVKLRRLTRAVKYTTMGNVWDEINDRVPQKADIKSISESAFRRWRRNGNSIRP